MRARHVDEVIDCDRHRHAAADRAIAQHKPAIRLALDEVRLEDPASQPPGDSWIVVDALVGRLVKGSVGAIDHPRPDEHRCGMVNTSPHMRRRGHADAPTTRAACW